MKKNTRAETFLFGGSYVPLSLDKHIPMAEWEKGMKQMKEAGFNAYRAFVAWNRIEENEGNRDFTELDYSLELAEKYGLRVTLNAGGVFSNLQGYRPPPWLIHKYGCQRVVNKRVEDIPGDNLDFLLCGDDPVYRSKAEEFIAETVKRYASHPALECWAVWNEPNINFCRCRYSLPVFRKWLKDKYADIDKLNARWGTQFPLGFKSWDDVLPPPLDDRPCMAHMLDWLEFWEERLLKQINRIDRLVSKIDPKHPTSLNVMGVHARDFTRIEVDQPGISAYVERVPYEPRKTVELLNVFLQSARAGRKPHERVRIIETDSGPRPFGTRPGDPELADIRDWAFIGNGAGMILSWMYRTRISGGHACQASLTGWDGSPTERLHKAGLRAKIIRDNNDRIMKTHPFPGQIAVLHDMKMYRISAVEGFHSPEKDFCMRTHDTAMMLLKDAGFSVEYIMESQLTDKTADRFAAILIPFCPHMGSEAAGALASYVEKGGTVITEAPFAVKNDFCEQYWEGTPGAGLDRVFGFRAVDMFVLEEDDSITLDGGDILDSASNFKEAITPYPGARVEGRYKDGAPAVIINKYGRGNTLFFGSLMLRDYRWESYALRRFISGFITEKTGVEPLYILKTQKPGEKAGGGIGVYPVTSRNKLIEGLYLVNFNEEGVKFKIEFRPDRLGGRKFRDILTLKDYPVTPCGELCWVEAELKAKGAAVLFAE